VLRLLALCSLRSLSYLRDTYTLDPSPVPTILHLPCILSHLPPKSNPLPDRWADRSWDPPLMTPDELSLLFSIRDGHLSSQREPSPDDFTLPCFPSSCFILKLASADPPHIPLALLWLRVFSISLFLTGLFFESCRLLPVQVGRVWSCPSFAICNRPVPFVVPSSVTSCRLP